MDEIDEMLKEIDFLQKNIKNELISKKIHTLIGLIYFSNMIILLKYFYKNIHNCVCSGTDILFVLYLCNFINVCDKYSIF